MATNTAILAGASGLVGGYLLRILLEDAFFDSVVTAGRRPLNLTHPKLSQRLVDFNDLHGEDLGPATHLFCTLGTTIRAAGSQEAFRKVDFDAVLALARTGVACGARSLCVVSSVGADPASGNFYLRVKGEMEEALAALPLDSLHVFRPSFLLGARSESRPGEQYGIAIARALEWAMQGPLRKYRPMSAPRLAQAMAVAAERGGPGVHVHHFDGIVTLAG